MDSQRYMIGDLPLLVDLFCGILEQRGVISKDEMDDVRKAPESTTSVYSYINRVADIFKGV